MNRRVVLVRTLLAAIAAIALLPGCQKVVRHPTVSVSPCFRILPQAHTALGGQGSFVAVSRLRGDSVTDFYFNQLGILPRRAPGGATTTTGAAPITTTVQSAATTTTTPDQRRDICVVAYKGTFDAGRIQHLIGGRQGRYALVIVSVRRQLVRAVFLRDQLPSPLHAH